MMLGPEIADQEEGLLRANLEYKDRVGGAMGDGEAGTYRQKTAN